MSTSLGHDTDHSSGGYSLPLLNLPSGRGADQSRAAPQICYEVDPWSTEGKLYQM